MGQFRDLEMWFLMSDSHLGVICYARAVCVYVCVRERALGLFWLLVTETISELVWGKQGGMGWDIRIWNITKGRAGRGDPWKNRCPGPREQLEARAPMLLRHPPLFLSVSVWKWLYGEKSMARYSPELLSLQGSFYQTYGYILRTKRAGGKS